jgi:5-methylcytosine-specific restriction endonuclease McrA
MRSREEKLEATRKWRDANRERTQEYGKIWVKANPDKVRVNLKTYQKKHRKEINAWARLYYAANSEQRLANSRAWQNRNPDKCRAYVRNRKARIRQAEGTHSGEEIKSLFVKQGGRCAICCTSIHKGYHADHITPLIAGGTNWIRNIQLLCAPCNLTKGPKDPIVWARENGRLL